MRQIIEKFIQDRLEEKLEPINKKLAKEGLSEADLDTLDAQAQALREKFSVESWLEDAAKRAAQIKLATHVLKMTSPEAKGSSIYWAPDTDSTPEYLSTASLGVNAAIDVVGNAAALDIFKFLNQISDGESLLQRALRKDAAFLRALSNDAGKAHSWCDAFAALAELDGQPATHPLAKQLYWSHGDNRYTILAPIASSALSSAMLSNINEERFSEAAKAARDAKNKIQESDRPVRYFIDVVEQNMGGTKPQNISYLNSQRGGSNLLLPSLPPVWLDAPVRLPRSMRSVFGRELLFQPGVRALIETLGQFLLRVQHVNNKPIRTKRADLTQAVVDRTLEYGYRLQSQPPGWSAQARLDIEECCWLDPGRLDVDDSFADAIAGLDWQAEVCRRFGVWFNAQLTSVGLPVGAPEYRYWRDELGDELASMREALGELAEAET